MPETSMIINYVPGEECRVAIACDGNLEEFHAERTDAVSRVNNIYVGKVTNVEAGIQAAFVDFGLEDNGFLHVSDLHPRYFVEDDATERVGKKTPRRERPPIQQCLKRGQEIIVQVLKEGVGTKGPTLTSYLSIPGRYLVMMPQMDKVGVSRKVEDEDERAKMRDILNELDLPEGFGFILRTAGFDRTKTDLKRDLAYLMRLWKDMEVNRKKAGKRTRLLYTESDLLVRALRDLVTSDISRIIVDDKGALARAAQFMKIVAPRSSVKVMHYTGGRPIFHAFGIEQQLALSHAREVPLPSGGRLVIDETEAIIAIDVNSGKSRSARDAETNAYKTNVEAVEAICRQLRLRDIGGIVINDLIDMRQAKNRKSIESLFRDRLKRDRAKSSIAPISPFGILEMTRQRMRGSLRSQHYTDCPTCQGKGLVQRPNSVVSDALREVAVLLEHEKVDRVELVVSGRIAGELLSNRRGSLNRLERATGKQVQVRVSETLPIDRFTIYAYDANGSDVDPAKLPKPKSPESQLEVVETAAAPDGWAVDPIESSTAADEEAPPAPEGPAPHPIEMEVGEELASDGEGGSKKKRRRRRRRSKKSGEGETTQTEAPESEAPQGEAPQGEAAQGEAGVADHPAEGESGEGEPAEGDAPKKKRRRRRRGKKSGSTAEGAVTVSDEAEASSSGSAAEPQGETDAPAPESTDEAPSEGDEQPKKKKRNRRSRRKRKPFSAEGEAAQPETSTENAEAPTETPAASEEPESADSEPTAKKVKKKRRRRKPASEAATEAASTSSSGAVSDSTVETKPVEAAAKKTAKKTTKKAAKKAAAKKAPRTLYGSTRRKIGPSEASRAHED
ncbi:Ribonuclease E [hydrothermal vent metagenome]|uniref:Ribonuclease G n=1 Tax=hydrothermal vent metagenome TaxID=652676 RepID=A0A3B1DJ88_9ZZZZ